MLKQQRNKRQREREILAAVGKEIENRGPSTLPLKASEND